MQDIGTCWRKRGFALAVNIHPIDSEMLTAGKCFPLCVLRVVKVLVRL